MILEFLKLIKKYCPWLWDGVEIINGLLIKLFWGDKLKESIGRRLKVVGGYLYRQLTITDAELLMQLIRNQPPGFDRYFKPHEFSIKKFESILRNGTYLTIGAFNKDELIGYCFIRLYINKSAFRGKLVDKAYQGRGIAKQMGVIMTEIASDLGFKVYATISKNNLASLQSAKYGATINIIKELPDNYLYVKISKEYDS